MMTQIKEWIWTKAEKEGLAKFATDSALQLFKLDESSFDLKQEEQFESLIEAIYNTLVEQKIKYDRDKYTTSETAQRIRTPVEILSQTQTRQGTCLDLALLFCGLCLGCNLLPKLILLEGHALVAVSLTLKRADWSSNRDNQKKFLGKRVEDAKGTERIQPEVFTNVKTVEEMIFYDENTCIVECTGFAYSKTMQPDSIELAGIERNTDGFLTFEQAKKVGRKQLKKLPFMYAIDIAVAHESWGIKPLEIPNLSDVLKQDLEIIADININKSEEDDIAGNEIDSIPSSGKVAANVKVGDASKSKIRGNVIGEKKTQYENAQINTNVSTSPELKFAAIPFKEDIERLTEHFTGREWLFKDIENWLANPDEQFFILTGEPGVGKSAIATQFIKNRKDKNDIAAYHFCIAGRGGTTEPNNVLQSLAAQLIEYFPDDYAKALVNTIKPFHLSVSVNITIETIKNSEVQGVVIKNLYASYPLEVLDIVLRKPLQAIDLSQTQKQTIVILIDSLDEAVTYKGEYNLVTLLSELKDLPPWVRFICTTRQERRVLSYLETLKPYIYHLEELSQDNLDDICQYIGRRLNSENIHEKLDKFKVESQTLVNSLASKSSGNFLYTQLVLNEIKSGYLPLDQLDTLPSGLYGIYHEMLRRRCTDDEWENKYQPILGTLAVTQAPVSETQLANFTKNRQLTRTKIKQNLRVLIQFTDIFQDKSSKDKTYTLFHQSFRDYLLDENKNEDFYCDAIEQHQEIIDFYKKETNDWNSMNQQILDNYGFLYLPKHLHSAEQKEELYTLLTGSPKWMEAKSKTFGNAAYVDDLNLAIDDFADPLEEPNQIVTLVKLFTARQVVNQRVGIPNLRTLVHLGREVEARSYARLSEDSESKLNSLLIIHYALQELSQFAPDILDEAEDIVEGVWKDNLSKATVLIQLAVALIEAKRGDKAKALLHKVPEVVEEIQGEHNKAKTLIQLANALAYAKDFREAEKVAAAAEKSARAIGSYRARAEALIEVAEVLGEIGCRTKAEHLFNEAQNVALQDEDRWRQAHALTELAIALAQFGSNDADLVFKKAEEVANAIPIYWQRVDRMIELVAALVKAKRQNKAIDLLEKVILYIESIDENDEYIDDFTGIAQGKLAVAIAHVGEFNQAERVANVIEDKVKKVEVLTEIAALAHAKNDDKARDFFIKAEEMADELKDGWIKSTALGKLAEALEEANNFNKAEKIATKVHKIERTLKEGGTKPEILSKLATVLAGAEYDDNKVDAVFREAQKAASNLKDNLDRTKALSKLAVALIQSGRNAKLILTEVDKNIHEILDTEKKSLVFDKEELKKSQLLIELTLNLAQAKNFCEAEKIANVIQEEIPRAEAQSKLAVELAQAQRFSEAKKIIQTIEYEPAKIMPLIKLAVALAHTEKKEADAIFSEAEKIALSIEDDNNIIKPLILIELVASLAQAKKFDQATKITNLINEQWAKTIALSKMATAYALLESFPEAENVVTEAEKIARGIENNIYYSFTMKALAKTLAQIKLFKKAFSIVGFKETSNEFLANLMEWQPAFEQFQSGLLAKIMQESIYIFGWEYQNWYEIHATLSNTQIQLENSNK